MKQAIFQPINSCRIFPEEPLVPILDLGDQPPANSLTSSPDELEQAIPLQLMWSEKAGLAQLGVDVDPEYLFKQYVWVTGTSQTAKDYSEEFFNNVSHIVNFKSDSFVVEVASNDGTFLRPFLKAGIQVLGIDPAENIAQEAREAGVNTQADFFSLEVARQVREERGLADFVFARNVLPHVPNILDVVHGMEALLKPEGTIAVEFHYARDILRELHYDSIYHEHYYYYSIKSLCALFEQARLFPFDVRKSPISGGSLVLFFQRSVSQMQDRLTSLMEEEQQLGLNSRKSWQNFSERSLTHRDTFRAMLESEIQNGNKMIGYGASARSSTLLNFAGITSKHLVSVADKSSKKHGLYTAGSKIPICSPEEAIETKPDTIVLLAWNFEHEITHELLERGYRGRLIVPLPADPRLIDLSGR